MTSKTSIATIVNVGGGGVALLLVAYTVGSYTLGPQEVPGCIANYQNSSTFGFRGRDGQLLSAIEVQALAGAAEHGLMENTRIVELSDGPATSVLEVKLGRAEADDPLSAVGVDFAWRPLGFAGASAACLRYSVYLPDDFDFGGGGHLPGIYGGSPPPDDGEKLSEGFAIRPKWNRDAHGEIIADLPTIENARDRILGYRKLAFKRGQWATIEQELVLNTPGKIDGNLKVWMNGELVVDQSRLKLREAKDPIISGVMARAGFAGSGRGAPAGEKGTLKLSPLEFAWRDGGGL